MTDPDRADPDLFQEIVDESFPKPERREMAASAERVVTVLELCERVMALHDRPLFADEHPEALQEIVDPTISVLEGPDVWSLPAGWTRILNRIHADLLELLGGYVVTQVK